MFTIDTAEKHVFEFSFEGEVYSLPARESLGIKWMRELKKRFDAAEDKQEEAVWAMLDLIEEYVPEVFDKLTFEQALQLVTAYTTDEGASMGESSPSSD